MTELLGLFAWTILAGSVMAAGLAMVGAQLAARAQSAQILVVSQASSLGVVAGLAVVHLWGMHEGDLPLLPLAFAYVCAAAVYFFCEKMVPATVPSRNSYYVGFFACLLSVTYLITAIIPGLESHRAATYFGDLALVSETEAKVAFVLSLVGSAVLLKFWWKLSSLSFDIAIFEKTPWPRQKHRTGLLFIAGALAMICLSIQAMGLLYTLSALFLPSLAVSGRSRGLASFTWSLILIAILGVVSGFSLSLWHGDLPTVPAVALGFVAWGLIFRAVMGLIRT